MKKYLLLFLSLIMTAALLAGCGSSKSNAATTADTQETTEEEEESETYTFEGDGIIEVTDLSIYKETEPAHRGTVTAVTYNNQYGEKTANVYVPYNYDPNGEPYNIVYVMHGGNEDENSYLSPDEITRFQQYLDVLIDQGDLEPVIAVSPSWNPNYDVPEDENAEGYSDSMDQSVDFAQNEFAQYLVPAIESQYNTYCESTDEAGIIASRDHRAFGGFSMGSVTTWNMFLNDMAYIRYFIPMSGDCWTVESTGGATQPEATVKALEDGVTAQGYTADDFQVYFYTGDQDMALPNCAPQVYAMMDSDMFQFGTNTFFGLFEGGIHGTIYGAIYMSNALMILPW